MAGLRLANSTNNQAMKPPRSATSAVCSAAFAPMETTVLVTSLKGAVARLSAAGASLRRARSSPASSRSSPANFTTGRLASFIGRQNRSTNGISRFAQAIGVTTH
jgi:hypothetical protein